MSVSNVMTREANNRYSMHIYCVWMCEMRIVSCYYVRKLNNNAKNTHIRSSRMDGKILRIDNIKQIFTFNFFYPFSRFNFMKIGNLTLPNSKNSLLKVYCIIHMNSKCLEGWVRVISDLDEISENQYTFNQSLGRCAVHRGLTTSII
jgi:hypothetical protein